MKLSITGTRTFVQLRVGYHQSVEVLLYLRRTDVVWFRQNQDYLLPEFLQLLETSVISRMFTDEVERNHAAYTQTQLPPTLAAGGIPITIGVKNNKSSSAAASATSNSEITKKSNPRRKRGRGTNQSKRTMELKRQHEAQVAREQRQNSKEVYYAKTDTIRIVYRLEDAGTAEILVFEKNEDSATLLRPLKKLSKRIVLWCYPSNVEQPVNEGFVRPELIPMSSLFRIPASEASSKG